MFPLLKTQPRMQAAARGAIASCVNSYGPVVGGGVFIDICKNCKVDNINEQNTNMNTNVAAS
jgi:hypothetical protein